MTWLYFGCETGGGGGHYLFEPGMLKARKHETFRNLDGFLAPQAHRRLYVAALTRFGGIGYSALSFWDQTVDTRPGSNSTIYAPSLVCSPETLLKGLERHFPSVWARLPLINIAECSFG